MKLKHLRLFNILGLIVLFIVVPIFFSNPLLAGNQSYSISSSSFDGELKSKGAEYGQYKQGDKGFNRGAVGGGSRGYEYVINSSNKTPGKKGARGAIDGEPDIGGSSKGNAFTSTTLGDSVRIGQALSGNYEIYKSFLSFDTSGIPYDATIKGATIILYGKEKHIEDGGENFDICVYKSVWTEPIWNPDWGAIIGQVRGSVNTADFKVGQTNTIIINPLNANYLIEKGGVTKIALVSSRTIDQKSPDGIEYVEIFSSNAEKKEYRPVLNIDYEGDPPNIRPSLNWTGEVFYKMNGVYPEELWVGENTLTFKVQYTHPLDVPPRMAQVWIDLNSDGDFEDPGEKINMKEENPLDKDYTNGKNYFVQVIINSDGVNDINYRFMFTDDNEIEAVGSPTQVVNLAAIQTEEKGTCFINTVKRSILIPIK